MQFPKIFLAFFIGSTVASLTLDERMDWAAEDPKGMYSSNKITKTWIQISWQNWYGSFSNFSHQRMI